MQTGLSTFFTKRTCSGLLLFCAAFCAPILAQEHAFEFVENTIQIELQGIDETQAETLKSLIKDQITLSGDRSPTEPLADDLAYFSRQQLVRSGYPQAQSTWKIVGTRIILPLQPGSKQRLGEITWQGDLVLDTQELHRFFIRPLLANPELDDKKHPQWVESEIQNGVALVTRKLRSEGYLKAEINLTRTSAPDDLNQNITLHIQSGPAFKLGRLTLEGAPNLIQKESELELEKATSGPFSEANVQKLESLLSSKAQKQGWLQAQTTGHYHMAPNGGTVDVHFSMNPGARSTVVTLEPAPTFSKGANRILRASFRPMLHQPYDANELNEAYRRALDTEIFAVLNSEVKAIPESDPDSALLATALHFTGEETKPNTLGIELGFDTFLGPQASLSFRNTNFRDTGNTLTSQLSYSLAGINGFISLNNPALLNSPYSASLRLGAESFVLYEYERYALSIGAELKRRVNRHFNYAFFFDSNINTVTTTLDSTLVGPEDYGLTALGLTAIFDLRDSPVLPKKGWYFSATGDYNFVTYGEATPFMHNELRAAFYQPVSRHLRLMVGVNAESILGASVEDIPIDSRVFNGGPNSVRAFAMRELGPVTPGDTPIGGTSALTGTLEISYEIIPNLEFALFSDIGSLGRKDNQTPFEFSTDYRTSIGAGLRYHLPFGPLRLDYGYNLDKRPGEKTGTLHLTAGFSF